jgi:collagenase-like PrtC family protease
VNLRCYLLSLLRIHSPNCEVCSARERYGVEMRRRLEEMNWRTQPHSPNNGVFDSMPGEVVARSPVPLAQKGKKIA